MSGEDSALLKEPAEEQWLDPPHISNWGREPKVWELVLLVAIGGVLLDVTQSAFNGWHTAVASFGDNAAYLQAARAIREWNFHGIDIQHFIGYPYTIAAVSLAFHLPLDLTLSLVASVASLLSMLLVASLFGTRVAAYFALTNLAWLQTSFLGGSEPLAVALARGGF